MEGLLGGLGGVGGGGGGGGGSSGGGAAGGMEPLTPGPGGGANRYFDLATGLTPGASPFPGCTMNTPATFGISPGFFRAPLSAVDMLPPLPLTGAPASGTAAAPATDATTTNNTGASGADEAGGIARTSAAGGGMPRDCADGAGGGLVGADSFLEQHKLLMQHMMQQQQTALQQGVKQQQQQQQHHHPPPKTSGGPPRKRKVIEEAVLQEPPLLKADSSFLSWRLSKKARHWDFAFPRVYSVKDDKGADNKRSDKTGAATAAANPLHEALIRGASANVVRSLLVRDGRNRAVAPSPSELVCGRDASGRTSLAVAIRHRASAEVVDLILNAVSDLPAVSADGGNSNSGGRGGRKTIGGESLLATAADDDMNVPLHVACMWGVSSVDVLRRLVRAHSRALHLRNFHGMTPVELAQRCGSRAMLDDAAVDFLLGAAYREKEHRAGGQQVAQQQQQQAQMQGLLHHQVL